MRFTKKETSNRVLRATIVIIQLIQISLFNKVQIVCIRQNRNKMMFWIKWATGNFKGFLAHSYTEQAKVTIGRKTLYKPKITTICCYQLRSKKTGETEKHRKPVKHELQEKKWFACSNSEVKGEWQKHWKKHTNTKTCLARQKRTVSVCSIDRTGIKHTDSMEHLWEDIRLPKQ